MGFVAERVQKVGGQTVQMTSSAAFQRPNRFAIRSEGLVPGLDVVSDGKKLYFWMAPLKKYTEAEAPASLDALVGDPIVQGVLQGTLMLDLCAADPYEKIMGSPRW